MKKRIPSSRDSPLKKSLIDKLDEIIEILQKRESGCIPKALDELYDFVTALRTSKVEEAD